MVDYSQSTKNLFAQSRNKELQKRGEEQIEVRSGYVENSSKPVPIAKYRDSEQFLEIDINATTVIGMFGPSGSGKTTGDMSIVSRCYRRGRLPVNLADTDLHTTNLDNHGGVSKELIDSMGLYKGESPLEIPQKTFLPKYLMNKLPEKRKPSNVESFSLGFQDVNSSELKFLLTQGLDKNQTQSMQTVLDNVEVDGSLSFDKLRNLCDELEDLHHSTAKKLKRNISVLENSEVISPRYRRDLVEQAGKGHAIGLGMKGFSRLGPEDYYLMEFMAKKVMEQLIDAKTDNLLNKPLFGVFPEAHHLMPKDGDSILADLLKRNFTFYQRRSDFPTVLDTQLPSQVDERVLEEVNHVFIGCDRNDKSLPGSEWKQVLKLLNVVANPQRDNKRWMRKIQQLGHRDFLYVNPSMTDPSEAPIVRFLAPLTSNP